MPAGGGGVGGMSGRRGKFCSSKLISTIYVMHLLVLEISLFCYNIRSLILFLMHQNLDCALSVQNVHFSLSILPLLIKLS